MSQSINLKIETVSVSPGDSLTSEIINNTHTHWVMLGSVAESNGPLLHSCTEVCVDTCVAVLCSCLDSRPANPNTEGSGPCCICLTSR